MEGIESGAAMQVRAEDAAFEAYRAATLALRDAELAVITAREKYAEALGALNKAIAPDPRHK